MANFQRGVYEPPDDLHVFDGSEDEEDSEGSRLPLLIVIALFVLASFAGVVWLAYERGVVSGRTEPRTIAAQSGPAKLAANDTEAQGPYKGLKIYEQPAGNESYDGTTVEDSTHADTSPASRVAPAPAPLPRKAPEAAQVGQVQAVATNDSEGKEKVVPSSTKLAAAAPPASEPETSSVTNEYVLQIGSYKTRDEANESWNAFREKHADAIEGLSIDIKGADLGDKGTWYRLRLGPFTDKKTASAACEKIKSAGGNCFLSR